MDERRSSKLVLYLLQGLAIGILASEFLPWKAQAQGTISMVPRTIPIIHRSPYFGVWATTQDPNVDPTTAGTTLNTWSGRGLGWTGYARVDGQVYRWLGNDNDLLTSNTATTTKVHLTATRTVLEMDMGPMAFTVSFLSPAEPTDLVLQSFPLAYMYVEAKSKDGQAHLVELYTDADASFVTSGNYTLEWNTTTTSTSVFHDMRRGSASSIEIDDSAENGRLYYAMSQGAGVTVKSGVHSEVRRNFAAEGRLDNTQDALFRESKLPNYPVVAFSVDLGRVVSTASPIVWAIGHTRESLLLGYSETSTIERRVSYFLSRYATIQDVIDAFLADFPNARSRAEAFDTKLQTDASAISTEYADLVSLSLRQTLGSIEISLPRPGSRGEWNSSNLQAHMRDTGVSRRGNPVEVMYAAMPALLHLNPDILMYLLRPLLAYQSSERYQNAYAAPDMGSDYLTATGNGTNTKKLGVENSGSMLIMAGAYGMKTKNWAPLNPYAKLFKTWADFLVVEALHTKDQMSADGLASEDQSNLALKGILGIYAMSKLREALGANGEEKHFLDQATLLAKEWEALAVGGSDHIASVYGQNATWGLAYNAYAAQLIAPDLFSKKVFEDQADFYDKQAQTALPFGLGYDISEPHVAKSHWTMFSAAASSSNVAARDRLIKFVHGRAFTRGAALMNSSFSTTYNADTGATQPLGGRSSSAQGAMFALLVSSASGTAGSSGATISESSKSKNIGGIVGGIIGGLAVLGLLAAAAWFFWRRRKTRAVDHQEKLARGSDIDPMTIASFSSPELRVGSFSYPPHPTSQTSGAVHNSTWDAEHHPEVVSTPFDLRVNRSSGGTAAAASPIDSSTWQPSPVLSKAEAERRRFGNEVRRVLVANNYSPSTVEDSVSTLSVAQVPSFSTPSSSDDTPVDLHQEIRDLRREVHLLRAQQQRTGLESSGELPLQHARDPLEREPPPVYKS